jgi:hypothetical protein
MDGPLLDLSDPAVKRMLKLAKKRGYVTLDELDAVLPPDEFSPDQIEDVLSQLSEIGISVVDAAPEHQGSFYRELANELRSFASGQRGDGRKLLERAANALTQEADDCWLPSLPGSQPPRVDQWVLVSDRRQGVRIARQSASGDWVGQDGQHLGEVTHWRPLPLPPSSSG